MAAKKGQLGTRLPLPLIRAMRAHSEKTGIPISRIVEDAIKAYLTSQGDK